MSYMVTQRTNEIGIRIALGAQEKNIFAMVLREGMNLAAAGIVLGTAGSLLLSSFLSKLLYGVSATDVGTFVLVALMLAGITLLACFIPARRATKVDPLVALRYE